MFPAAMSNSTSLSEEASVSSGSKLHDLTAFNPSLTPISPHEEQQQQKVKKKRNLPGNPDPDSEVIALSPKSLMATNRFVCEICNKGFQRDQNLQLHRRGHNLPWKLRQRSSKEAIRKRVYVCPEPSCVHHHPSRALGDLTGIKKHFYRKHGEKKWKCDKCSKKYAVQSDWKAHAKTCGTREYRCDCGTLFSRKDSFVTHRAFCDALAEESARLSSAPPILPIITTTTTHPLAPLTTTTTTITDHPEQHQHQQQHSSSSSSSLIMNIHFQQQSVNYNNPAPPVLFGNAAPLSLAAWEMKSSEGTGFVTNRLATQKQQPPTSAPALSATALLQKAATMGAVMSNTGTTTRTQTRTHPVATALGVHMAPGTMEGRDLDAWRKGMMMIGSSSSSSSATRDFLGLQGGGGLLGDDEESASDNVRVVRELMSFTGMGIGIDSFSYQRGPAMKAAPTYGFQTTQAWTDC
ncbi:hypothetical protein H6P81_004744 [Aristolochia fimbriata]|uniref:C2H2-type domain-containing protein n=1 Tax=Aristolochia fimbriata TaxID=158543 RepID=A0AAV7EUT5_ARIFI|nr:hypothetical protein H6P81_004744 [Aristolochia fimbriata]